MNVSSEPIVSAKIIVGSYWNTLGAVAGAACGEAFLVGPVHRLGLRATVHGVRYPDAVRRRLARAGIAFDLLYTSASLLGVAAAAQAGFAATVLGRTGLPPGLEEVPGLPACGTAEMCLFGDAEGRSALVEPLIGFIRESRAAPRAAM